MSLSAYKISLTSVSTYRKSSIALILAVLATTIMGTALPPPHRPGKRVRIESPQARLFRTYLLFVTYSMLIDVPQCHWVNGEWICPHEEALTASSRFISDAMPLDIIVTSEDAEV